MRATSCARCSRSICARTARPVGTSSNRRENGNGSIRVQRPGLPRRALYRGSRQEGGLDGCRCRARPHRPATPGRRGPRPPHGLCGFRRGGVRCRGRRRTSGLSGLLARGCEARGGPRGDAGRRHAGCRQLHRPHPRCPGYQGVVGSIFLPNRGDAPGRPDCPGLADGVPGAHGARRPRPVFLHLRAMRRTRDRIGVHALPVLRRPHGRRRTWRSGDERGDPCRLAS